MITASHFQITVKEMGKPFFQSIKELCDWRSRMKYADATKRDEGPKVNGRIEAMEETLKATTLEIEMLELHLRGHEESQKNLGQFPCQYSDEGTRIEMPMRHTCDAWLYYTKSKWRAELQGKLDTARQREAFTRMEISKAKAELEGGA